MHYTIDMTLKESIDRDSESMYSGLLNRRTYPKWYRPSAVPLNGSEVSVRETILEIRSPVYQGNEKHMPSPDPKKNPAATAAAHAKAPAAPDQFDRDDDEEELTEAQLNALPSLPQEFGADKLENFATGFAPYWKPTKGVAVDFIPVGIEHVEKLDITHILCRYIGDVPLECRTGAKGDDDDDDKSTPVTVRKGDMFSVGWYATLPVELGIKDAVPTRIIPVKRGTIGTVIVDGQKQPKKLWTFKVQTSPKFLEKLNAEKARVMGFGMRDIKKNQGYLLAFTTEGLRLNSPSGMTTTMSSLAPKPAGNSKPANAEA